jgi:uncharacterized membrane protein YidH (DUF202 family)
VWACAAAYRQWQVNERTMEEGESVGQSRLPFYVAAAVAVIAAAALLFAAIGRS